MYFPEVVDHFVLRNFLQIGFCLASFLFSLIEGLIPAIGILSVRLSRAHTHCCVQLMAERFSLGNSSLADPSFTFSRIFVISANVWVFIVAMAVYQML